MKILLVLLFFVFTQVNAYSMPVTSYCAQHPTQTKNINSTIAKYSGANFVTKQVLENVIKKTLKEELNTNFDVNLVPLENTSLLNGQFKSLSALGQHANRKGLFFSTISAQTLCPYNHIKYENNSLYFLENMVVNFSARMTAKDLNKTINSFEYITAIKNTKIKTKNAVLAEISGVNITLNNNKIILQIDVLIPFIFGMTPQSIDIATGLSVEDGKISFSDIKTSNPLLDIIMQNSESFLDKINPFVYKVQTKDKYDIILNVETVKIENNEIFVSGTVVIPKNYPNNGV